MDKEEKIEFAKKDGRLVRYVAHKAPLFLNGQEIGFEDSLSTQYLTEEGAKTYSAVGYKLRDDLKKQIEQQTNELKTLDNLGHDELTKEKMEEFIRAIKDAKDDKRKIKVSTEGVDRLCSAVYRKLAIKSQLSEAQRRLVKVEEEIASLEKVQKA
jgi:hypothetical protein